MVHCEVIRQFQNLLKGRGFDCNDFEFCISCQCKKIYVIHEDEICFIINFASFTDCQIANQSELWVQYKTDTLNNSDCLYPVV